VKKTTSMWPGVIAVGVFVLAVASACGDDAAGDGGFRCPAVGEKSCENDVGATQIDVTFCKQCEAELRAQESCLGPPTCGPDGLTATPPRDKCKEEQAKVLTCYQGGGDAGADAGEGGSSDARAD
jgi:hypothetical protein